jgi:hypothetical protein
MSKIGLFMGVLFALAAPHASASTVSDDFSADSGKWTYAAAAYRDATSGYVVLTQPDQYMTAGQVWLTEGRTGPFKVTFKYFVGGGNWPADGLVFMFNKQTGYEPDVGGTLGFTLPPHGSLTPVPGYGVEVDTFDNYGWEPVSGPHLALVQDTVANNLAWSQDPRAGDGLWHTVVVKVEEAAVTVSVDGVEQFYWAGAIDRTWSGFGFSGATGAGTNWHLIDDVTVEDLSVAVAIDIKPGDANNTFNNDGSGVLPVAILGGADFDVTTIDPATVALESLRVKVNGRNHALAHYEDMNADGFVDLLVQIADADVVFATGETVATLTGNLLDGTPIVGSDAIRIVP